MRPDNPTPSAFTLVEILVVLAVVGILGGIAYNNYTGLRESSADTKLRSDVRVINNAIDAYRAAGGSITGATPADVLRQLKATVGTGATEMGGFTNAFVDRRTKAVMMSPAEASGAALRAVFSPGADPKFFLTNGGDSPDAVKEFVFDEAEALVEYSDTGRSPMLAQTDSGWVWGYSDSDLALSTPPPALLPGTLEGTNTNPAVSVTPLPPPTMNPAGGSFDLALYPYAVSLSTSFPPGGWGINYDFSASTNPATLLTNGTVAVGPDSWLSARTVSYDPSRYTDSAVATNFFGVQATKLQVAIGGATSVRYADVANGPTTNVTVSLERTFQTNYAAAGDFTIYYTSDGSDPRQTGNAARQSIPDLFGTATIPVTDAPMTIQAVAIASKTNWFSNSVVASNTVGIDPTDIPLEIRPANPVGLPIRVTISTNGYAPPGYVIYYTTNGVPPLSPADGGGAPRADADVLIYTNADGFRSPRKTSFTVIAQATVPGLEKWFSSRDDQRYEYIGVRAADLVGMNILGGDVNGVINGNVYLQSAGDIANINASGRINGNLYVPGYARISDPNVIIERNELFDYDVVSTNSTQVTYTNLSGTNILVVNKDRIGGAVYNSKGQKIPEEQALDPRQIVDDIGSDVGPPEVKINPGGYVDGKVFRNVDVPDTPDIPVIIPPFPTNTAQVVGPTNTMFLPGFVFGPGVTNMPTNTVPYTVNMTNPNAVLVLGTNTTPLVTNRYFFNPGTWRAGRVEVRGPVEIFFSGNFVNEGVQFGTNSSARSTVIYVTNGSVSIGQPSASADPASLYAIVDVRSNTFTVDNSGAFYGGALTRIMDISRNGFVDVSQ